MGYSVKILQDSVGPTGKRLTTFECSYPRFIHAEVLTHRKLSRNSASSRAIPIEKMIQRVEEDPVLPKYWGRNQKGMQASEELGEYEKRDALKAWFQARDQAVVSARALSALGVHKQLANRVLEPFMFITVIISATDWDNFYHLRRDAAAQPEFKWLADEMFARQQKSQPARLGAGEWHLPLVDDNDRIEVQRFLETYPVNAQRLPHVRANEILCKVSVGRCARVSYLTHDGRRDIREDIALHDRLMASGHWSPFEHIAQVNLEYRQSGNFGPGWQQYRKRFATEHFGGSDT